MINKVKDIDIKNRIIYFLNDIVNIKNLLELAVRAVFMKLIYIIDKKETKSFYILLAILLITIVLLIVISEKIYSKTKTLLRHK